MLTTLTIRPTVAAAADLGCVIHAYGEPVSQSGNGVVVSTNAVEAIWTDAECSSPSGQMFSMSVGVWVETQLSNGSWVATGCTSGPFNGAGSNGTATTGTYGVATADMVCNDGPASQGGALRRAHAQVWDSIDQLFRDGYSLNWIMN